MGSHVLCRNPEGPGYVRADALQGNIFLLMSTPQSCHLLLIHAHAYLASASSSRARPAQEPSLKKDTGAKKDHQSLGLEDLKCKVQELSASHVFYRTEEGSLQRKKSWQHSETKEEFEQPWNPSYRSSSTQLEHCPPHIALLNPFLDYIGH